MAHLRFTTRIARPAEDVFRWHLRPGAFARLQPPWEKVELRGGHPGVSEGSRVSVSTSFAGIPQTWVVEHRDIEPGRRFRDVMQRGPFAQWVHTHRFEAAGPDACELVDDIEYTLPLGGLGNLLGGHLVRRRLERMFTYRHEVTRADLEDPQADPAPRDIVVAGASGLVGSMLVPYLQTQGHRARRLVRRPAEHADEISWRPEAGELDPGALAGVDAVINLAGANVGSGRWTAARRRAIVESRRQTARTLIGACAAMARRPEVYVSAGATGWYGDRGDEVLTESSESGTGFLAEVCRTWEGEAWRAEDFGIRAVVLRFGVVLTPRGGALARMLPVFRAGLGGRLGDGRQWFPWVDAEDVLRLVHAALLRPEWRGAFNAVAPGIVRNAGFTAALGRVLERPTLARVPAPVLRLAFGQMADEALLAGARVRPRRLEEARHGFRMPELEPALRRMLGRTTPDK